MKATKIIKEERKEAKVDTGEIIKISGPIVVADKIENSCINDLCRVGKTGVLGEIIEIHQNKVSIQVYGDTTGIRQSDKVTSTNQPLCVELGPGLLKSVYDGIQRPLNVKEESANSLDRKIKWKFNSACKLHDIVSQGDVIGTVQETPAILHKIIVPFGISGEITLIQEGDFSVTDVVCRIKTENGEKEVTLMQKWPVRKQRPYKTKLMPDKQLLTGQRTIDTFFPIAKGGTSAAIGTFGTGKTELQKKIAKYSDCDIVIFVGCGIRGSEIADVLNEFSKSDILNKSVIIANTSDMPVAEREASINTGITIAEYYRDMGYSVAIITDSLTRWAEALREISGKLNEMFGKEGYPSYLGSRLAAYLERAGMAECYGKELREGSITSITTVSPAGSDLTELVSQLILKDVKVNLEFDRDLSNERHFPALNCTDSYSQYADKFNCDYHDFSEIKEEAFDILKKEDRLRKIANIASYNTLLESDKQILNKAKLIRNSFLDQDDEYSSIEEQYNLLKSIIKGGSYYE